MCEERELGGGEPDLAVTDVHPPPVDLHPDRSHRQYLLAGGRPVRPAEDRANPGDELPRAEGLGHVVVGAQLETDDPVDLVVAGGDEQDGGPVVVRPHPAAHLDAVHAGQADVEDDRDGVEPADGVERRRTVGLDLHPEAVLAQVEPDEVGDGAVVLDDEDETARVGVGHWSCLRAAGGGADRVTDRVRAGTRSPTCRTGVRVEVAFDGVDRGLDVCERVRRAGARTVRRHGRGAGAGSGRQCAVGRAAPAEQQRGRPPR